MTATRFKVKGADAGSGRDVVLEVAGDSPQHAEQVAGAKGVLVESVEPVAPAAMLDYSNPQIEAKHGSPRPPASRPSTGTGAALLGTLLFVLMVLCFLGWITGGNTVLGALYLIAMLLCILIAAVRW